MAAIRDEARGSLGAGRGRVPLFTNAAVQSLALLTAVSCVRTVYCAAAGTYFTKTDTQGAYVQTETRGRWRAAVRITALPAGAQTSGPAVLLTGLSCLSSGCLAAGAYQDKASALVPMTVLGSGRTWGRGVPVRLPHGAAAGAAQTAELIGVTCYPVGIDCTGAGEYTATGSPDISEAMSAVSAAGDPAPPHPAPPHAAPPHLGPSLAGRPDTIIGIVPGAGEMPWSWCTRARSARSAAGRGRHPARRVGQDQRLRCRAAHADPG